jgi:hypothetical protein
VFFVKILLENDLTVCARFLQCPEAVFLVVSDPSINKL